MKRESNASDERYQDIPTVELDQATGAGAGSKGVPSQGGGSKDVEPDEPAGSGPTSQVQ